MRIIFFFFCLLVFGELNAQRKSIDFRTPESWPRLQDNSVRISNDGKYFAYEMTMPGQGRILMVQATDSGWKRALEGMFDDARFTEDSRRLLFYSVTGDSLGILELSSDSLRYLAQVLPEFGMPKAGNGRWLAYRRKAKAGTLVLKDLFADREMEWSNIDTYAFDADGRGLVLSGRSSKDSVWSKEVIWLDLPSMRSTSVCHDCEANRFVFDDKGRAVAFLGREGAGESATNQLFYFKEGMDSAKEVIDPVLLARENYKVSGLITFNEVADQLFFYLDTVRSKKAAPVVKMDLWGYRDEELINSGEHFPKTAVVYLDMAGKFPHFRQLGGYGHVFINHKSNGLATLVIESCLSQEDRLKRSDLYMISNSDGSRKLIERNLYEGYLHYSAGGKYILWYDLQREQWVAYNMARGTRHCLSCGFPVSMHYPSEGGGIPMPPYGMAGWLEQDSAVLLNDQFDVWRIDPDGSTPPVNLTGGYGRRHQVQLRCIDDHQENPIPVRGKEDLLFLGVDLKTKCSVFYQLVSSGGQGLKKLYGDSLVYYSKGEPNFSDRTPVFYPVKAKDARVYIVNGMNTTHYPNFYATTDFTGFKQLTWLAPQQAYNWYTTQLLHWQRKDRTFGEGILYKPADFDPGKRYPVIFYYYEKLAHTLHYFLHPELSSGTMNIPWFVSNGYLVFVPDIRYRVGHPGESAYEAVAGAAEMVAKLPYVDAKHMGLQGHSFGGFETNYIVTRTTLFAAAATSEGVSNNSSYYGRLGRYRYLEQGQGRMGTTLWKRPDLYLENSPVFQADRVTTPMLILQNKGDFAVPFEQGTQMFAGLSRLGKKAWMLSYDGEEHTLENPKNQLDYSMRMAQFFAYYLKGALPPRWMTKGVLSGKEGDNDGLELDHSGAKP